MSVKITKIESGSLAEKAGLQPGHTLDYINSKEINDILDLQFYASENDLVLDCRDSKKQRYRKEINNPRYEGLGLEIQDFAIRKCTNDCVFCFVAQMPPNMRETLYIKDDDYRLSFLTGAFITLTNLSIRDMARVIEQKLSPLYVSVHSIMPDVRKQLFRAKNWNIREKLTCLFDGGIQLHTQIVLCPEINYEGLFETIDFLSASYPNVLSIGIVPVGITRFQQNEIAQVDSEFAKKLISEVNEKSRMLEEKYHENFLYLSDEFYLLANEPIPPDEYYNDYAQFENGIGMVRTILDNFAAEYDDIKKLITKETKITIVTSELSALFMKDIVSRLNEIELLSVNMEIVPNYFFGTTVTVTGLLTARDVINHLKDADTEPVIFLPHNMFNTDGLTLDNKTASEMEAELGRKIVCGEYSILDMFDKAVFTL